MIDCSINIDDLISNHPEEVRSTFGVGDNDNFIILAPNDGSGCIFANNRLDDYEESIRAFILVGVGYIPSILYRIDGGNIVDRWDIDIVNETYKIYYCDIKNCTCSSNLVLQVSTYRERFWVDVNLCEGGEEYGRIIKGGKYVGYGDNIMMAALPNDIGNYMVIWTDVTDPQHPIPLPEDPRSWTIPESSCNLYNITSNHSIEVCFERIPKRYTFSLFTNDGKIDNMNIEQMMRGYKLGDVKVTFYVNDEETEISTEDCGYGVIKTYDFITGTLDEIVYDETSTHKYDRGIILYNVPDTQELTVGATQYEDGCCHIDCDDSDHSCIKEKDSTCNSIDYTTFKGWINETFANNSPNYSTLNNCNLIYPTFEWGVVDYVNMPNEFIHQVEMVPTNALCSDYYYVSTNLYYRPYNGEPPSGVWERGVIVPAEEFDTYVPMVGDFGDSIPDYIHVYTEGLVRDKWFKLETETPGYFSRNMVSGDIMLDDNCYEYLDSSVWPQEFTQTFSNNVTFYAIFEPTTSTITLNVDNNISDRHVIGIIDYCFTYQYFEIDPSRIDNRVRIVALPNMPLIVNEDSYEYIIVNNTYYHKEPYYRESGTESKCPVELKEINGMNIYLRILGETDNTLVWNIIQEETPITLHFNGDSPCNNLLPYQCQELNFVMCNDITFIATRQ